MQKPRSGIEIFNDYDGNLIHFWKTVQTKPKELIKTLDYSLMSREVFDEYKQKYLTGNYTDDIERAHIYLYLNWYGFAGDMKRLAFTYSVHTRPNAQELADRINTVYERIKGVVIEHQDYADIMKGYDHDNSFFFIDPPYYKCNAKYAVGDFAPEDYERLANCCKGISGKFLLTISDHSFIREVFKDFNINTYDVIYSMARHNAVSTKELIVTNYDLPEEHAQAGNMEEQ